MNGVELTEERARLGTALREFLDQVVRTGASEDELREITARIDGLSARLDAAPVAGPREYQPGTFRHDMAVVSGRAHPLAPQLHMRATDEGAVGSVVLGPVFEGAPGLAHGGVVALLFDDALGFASDSAGYKAMTGSLTVRYKAPVPLNVGLQVRTWVDRAEGRKVFLCAELTVEGRVCAEAEAVFIKLTDAHVAAMFPGGS